MQSKSSLHAKRAYFYTPVLLKNAGVTFMKKPAMSLFTNGAYCF